ncbi:radical SAM protein [Streptacidiphilus anmyonensis]|uniref:radical SAM protein n=1 Tax=Streptacidiphilus anmyonensis TaxID=405782 RepID=UPI0005A6D2E1|nr:radical SAM protein [Streptacidiphilus anmyonensis]
MELAEIMGLRPEPCAGLLVAVTRRCPLRCAHCSAGSGPEAAERPDPGRLLGFVRSFRCEDRPEVMLLTGGEPLLHPDLVIGLTRAAQAVGTRVALLSGMFFARGERVPGPIRQAITAVDHFSASLDEYHEREVPREHVFRVVRGVLDAGVAVSFHLAGSSAEDPYLADVIAAVRRTFGDRAPMLVNEVRQVGRAAGWAHAAPPPGQAAPAMPCAMAAWPVVAFDGAVVACCNQHTVDRRPVPAHLSLGHVDAADWPTVRRRSLASPELRLVRAVGPLRVRDRYAQRALAAERTRGGADTAGPCAACRTLHRDPAVHAGAARDAAGPVGSLLDQAAARQARAAGPAALVRAYGCAPYAHLVAPGGDAGYRPGRTR